MTRDCMRHLGIPEHSLDAALAVWTREFTAAVALAVNGMRSVGIGAPDGHRHPGQGAAGRLTPAICAKKANCDHKTIMRAFQSGAIWALRRLGPVPTRN